MIDAFVPGLGVNGRATGSLDFSQANSAAFPRADARLQIANFSRTTAVSVSQPVDVNFVGKLLPDGGEARAVMRRRGTVIGRMNASLNPLPPGSGSWTTRLLSAPLGGGIRYNGPADTLFSLPVSPTSVFRVRSAWPPTPRAGCSARIWLGSSVRTTSCTRTRPTERACPTWLSRGVSAATAWRSSG